MLRFTGIVIGLIAVLFGLPTLAATVQPVATVVPVTGQLSLSRGQGFVGITKPTPAKVGDQVMVGIRGRGKIVYSEGCVVDVLPGAVVGVAGSCKVATAKPMMAGLECDPNTDPKCLAPVAAPAPVLWPWLAGAGLAVGVACIGFCRSNDNNNNECISKPCR